MNFKPTEYEMKRLLFSTTRLCTLIICTFFLIGIKPLKAQGTTCATATPIILNTCGTYSIGAGFDVQTVCGKNRTGWFCFTPTATQMYTISVTGAAMGNDPAIYLATNCPPPSTGSPPCNDVSSTNVETLTTTLNAGTKYYIGAANTGNITMTFCLNCPNTNACDPASNCTSKGNSNQILVDLGASCQYSVPNVASLHAWTAMNPCVCWDLVSGPVQTPAAGTMVTIPSGNTCPNGTINVNIAFTYTRVNMMGMTETCTLNFTDTFRVRDITAPVLSLPASINVNSDANCVVNLAAIEATFDGTMVSDNCTSDPALLTNLTRISGMIPTPAVICPGQPDSYIIMYQTRDACLNLSNISSVTINVSDNIAPTITCPAAVVLNVNATCQATIPRDNPATYTDNCDPGPGTYSWRVIASSNTTVLPIGNIPPGGTNVNLSNVCNVVTATVRICAQDCFGNGPLNLADNTVTANCCTYMYTIQDITAPTISAGCGTNTNLPVGATCTAVMPNLSGLLTVTNNCGGPLTIYQLPAPGSILNDGNDDAIGLAQGVAALPVTCLLNNLADPIEQCSVVGQNLKIVNVSFVLVDCSGNCTVVNNCRTITLQDNTAPNTVVCPANPPVFNLVIDPATCTYSTVTIPVDYFDGLATGIDNCDPNPIEHNNAVTFNCSQIGTQLIPVWAEDCNGNISGILDNCPVVIQVNPLDADWNSPGVICMNDLPLDLCTLVNGQNCGYWSGDHISPAPPNNRCNGGTPAMFNPTNPGNYSVTYTVGDANCHVELTRIITVEPNLNLPFLVANGLQFCTCPDELIDFEQFLLNGIPQGGTWALNIVSGNPTFLQPGGPGAGNDHVALYTGGCGDVELIYTLTDCGGATLTDQFLFTIHECSGGSFDVRADFCQDEANFIINPGVSEYKGCDEYLVTYDVISGPSGDLLIGGAPVSFTIGAPINVTVNPAVQQGTYRIRMTISDPLGICNDYIYEEVTNIHRDGANPNSIVNPGLLCETGVFPLTLNVTNPNDEVGIPLPAADIKWFGIGTTDIGTTANFTPPDLDGDGLPGPGVFSVCVDLGDARCTDRYCRDITVQNAVLGSCIIANQTLCLVPNSVIPYNSFLATGAPLGGTWSTVVAGAPSLLGIAGFNGFVYNGGCGTLTITYTLSGQCGAPITCTGTITITEKPEIKLSGDLNLCATDLPVTIRNNGTGIICGTAGVFSLGAGTPLGALVTTVPGVTASFDPDIAGEGRHYIIYTIGVAGCNAIDTIEINVSAASDPLFEAGGPYCVDMNSINLSLIDPNPSIQEGSPDNKQEVNWTSSCTGCLVINSDSTTAVFNPSAAGVGYHLICVTTGDPSCMKYHCDLVYVAPSQNATLATDRARGCFDLRLSPGCGTGVVEFYLSEFYTSTTTRGGTWSYVSGPGCNILNETLIAEAGCHELQYTVPAAFPGATGACASTSSNVFLLIVEQPIPDFEISNDVCWDGVAGSLTIPTLYNGETFGDNATRTYNWNATLTSGAGPIPTFSSTSVQNPDVIIQGAGTFQICITETLTYSSCGILAAGGSCTETHCEQLVVHQTTVEANPTWTPPSSFCIDQNCIDLDVLVGGTINGVFSGKGVQLDPSHPNYRFCPTIAGAGTHSICYTVNNGAGCTAVECHNITVFPAVSLSCGDTRDTLQCATRPLGPTNLLYGPHGGVLLNSRYTLGTHPLNSMLCSTATRGGAWSLVTAPGANQGAVAGDLLYFTNPGCYTVRYTVSSAPGLTGACLATQDFTVHVGEMPNPSFDLPNSICWDQVTPTTLTIPGNFITSPVYTGTVVRSYRSTNTSVATVTPLTGVITIVGNGTTTICMQESITLLACGITFSVCIAESCEILRVINNTTVVNPNWNAPTPLCISSACIDLDALVLVEGGTPNGIFTGQGVQLDPAHPNYRFCPAVAGVGTHAVTYTVNSPDGCTGTFTRNIEVRGQCIADLDLAFNGASFGCYNSDQFRASSFGPRNEFDLSRFYTPTTTRGGVWEFVSNPPNTPGPNAIANETLFGGPGCYVLRYITNCSPCPPDTSVITFQIVERPTPKYDIAEEACWNGVVGSLILPTYYQGTTWGTNALTRTYSWSTALISGTGPVPTLSSGVGVFQAINNPAVTINGAGVFEICVTELLTYAVCNGFATSTCANTYCERITIHQTNVEVLPTWTPIAPVCIDNACIDLDIRVTGNTGGVFNGTGVQLDPSHPNYRFCPAVAGPGTHTICYTVQNGAGCTAVECHNVIVYPAVSLDCQITELSLQCATKALGTSNNSYGPFGGVELISRYTLGTYPLNNLLCSTATKGGTWILVSEPSANQGAVTGELLHFTNPGCYTVRYIVSSGPDLGGACLAQQDFTINIGEAPNPSFDLPNTLCWDQITPLTLTIPGNYITSPTYTGTVTRTYSSSNALVATVDANTGIITIVGNGLTTICMEETINLFACGEQFKSCIAQTCEVLTVVNNTTVVNPNWSAPPILCISSACIDLDALVSGTPNGIFTGQGVQLDPTHPNYRFCPAVAGVGIHAVTYTVNSPDGCTASFTRNIEVIPQCVSDLNSAFNGASFGCYNSDQFRVSSSGPRNEFDLTRFYLPTTTRGGVWTFVSNPPNVGPNIIANETLFGGPGCYVLRYTVSCDPCTSVFSEITFQIVERPTPVFDLTEEACWNGVVGSLVLPTYYQGTTWGTNALTRTYSWSTTLISGAGPVPTLSSGVGVFQAINNPSLTINGAGVFEICVNEQLTYAACNGFATGVCNNIYCERITIHQTNLEVNPSWTPLPIQCVDDACIDLDIRVTGNSGGVFKGIGVQIVGAHPNYEFCPAIAGPGTHTICYTVNNGAGCTAVECHNVVVYPAVVLACVDTRDTLQCATKAKGANANTYGPFNGSTLSSRYTLSTHSLNAILCPTATQGGTWSFISGPTATSGAVADQLLYYTDPGCYTIRYTVTSAPGLDGACTAFQDFTVYVGEMPMPMFDLPDHVCWDQVTVVTYNIPTNFLTSPAYTGTVTRNYRSTNTSVATVTAAGLITIVGNGLTSICMEEIITTVACAGVTTQCTSEVCEVLRVDNTLTIVNPNWNPQAPLCISDACIDLDALVLAAGGTPNGIFTGHGVQLDPSHPNYRFCPAVAGVGTHAITYTVNSPDGCTGVFTRNIVVVPQCISSLLAGPVAFGCYHSSQFRLSSLGPRNEFDLSRFYLPTTTRGGTWTFVSNPPNNPGPNAIFNETLFGGPGCYTLRYTVNCPPCPSTFTDITFLISERPEPIFDLTEEACWNGIAGSLVLPTYYQGKTWGINATTRNYNWSVTAISGGPVPTLSSGVGTFQAINNPTITINGAGEFEICVTEQLIYDLCGGTNFVPCTNTYCERITIHQTNIEVNPTWTPIPPQCVDDACIDLDIRVTGNNGGVFKGIGVQLDPTHPNYRFCPAVAGPGTHTICYTVNNGAGCTAVECHNVVVYDSVRLACTDTRDTLQCATKAKGPNSNNYGPYNGSTLSSRYSLNTHSLNALLCPTATRGGTWSYLTGPTATSGAVADGLIYYTDPGCYTVRYTVSSAPGLDGACIKTQDFSIHVGEMPMPMFDLPDNVCWDQVTTVTFNIPVGYLTSPTYTGTVVRNYRSTNPSVAIVNAAGLVTITGNGTTNICMEEIITTIACAGVTTTCRAEVCEVLRVENTNTITNPSWNDPGPICIDQACIDLDALVGPAGGTLNGKFTGRGVRLDPIHPNYCFDPAVAGVGIHAITYTVNSPDGCTGVFTRNIRVYPANVATLVADIARGCYIFNKAQGGPFIDFNLEEFFLTTTTRGGNWTYISGPGGAIRNYTLSASPGCHQIRYTVPPAFPGAIGACGQMTDDVFLLLTEAPEPDFDLAEEACWNGVAGSLIIPTLYSGETSGIGGTRTFAWTVTQIVGPGPIPTFSSATAQSPTITIQGAGTFELCITETMTYAACGTVPGGLICSETHCERITIHQTNVEVNPSWIPIPPQCVDDPCIDLDIRVTGNTGGVFKGVGVQLDPTHPNYRFCPAVAGPGTHTICYTVNNGAGCTAVECHDVLVHPLVVLACTDSQDTVQCATKALGPNTNNYGPFNGVLLVSRYTLGVHSLEDLLCSNATRGGTWSFVSGPAASSGAVDDNLLYYTTPGCYTVRYTISRFAGADGGCVATQDFTIHIGEMPMPMFDLPDNVCWDQVNVVQYNIPSSFLTSPTYTGTVVRNYRSTNTTVATVNAAGIVTIVGNGITTICMEEVITTIACGVTTTCRSEFCEVIRVQNNTTIVNPTWTAIGPFCVDDACVRLDLLVTGSTGGIFTGRGVRPPGGSLIHPQYEFCPAVAGPGIHTITYTVNSPDGCTGIFSRNIQVFDAVNATLVPDSIVCQVKPSGIIDLTALFTPTTTGGGIFTKTSGPTSGRVIGNNQFNYIEAGCYCFSYTVSAFPGADGACIATGTACLLVTEMPTPNFDIQNERCWNVTDPIETKRDTIKLNSPSYDPAGVITRVLRVMSGPATVIANGPTIFAVEYTGAGNVMLCLEEKLSYAACGTIPGGRVCIDTICKLIKVQDGTAIDAGFTIIGAKTEYCPGDTITFIPNIPGGIFNGTNVGNSNPVGTSGGMRFTACGIYEVTYSIESNGGCENKLTRTFFTDRTNPVFAGPTISARFDTIVECDGLSQTARMNAWANRFTFTDNCQFRTNFKVFDRRSGCSPSTGLYIYEVTGRDTCGNETNVYPSYRVQDTTRPAFTTLPTDLVVECGNETDAQILNWLNINGRAIANDICSGSRLRWSHNFSGDIADYCSAIGTLVTFTVFDECNNSNNASARIIVRDLIAPIWNIRPQNLTLECDGTSDPLNQINAWLNTNGDGVALDSCQVTVRYSNNYSRLIGGCNRNTGSALVTFTATDVCNNSVTAQATVRVRDTIAPEIISPAKDTTIFCSVANGSPANITAAKTAWLNAMGRSVSIDRCDGKTRNAVIASGPDLTSSTLMRTVQGCAAPLVTETWMFQFRDSCGNISAATIADFVVRDTTSPVWAVNPTNLIVECNRQGNPNELQTWLNNNGNGSLLFDACNGTTRIEHDLVRHYDKCGNTDSLVYKFTAFDCSGNSSSREASFYIRDITAPVIDPASGYNKITSCDQSNAGNDDDIIAWLDSLGGLRATDACSDVINWTHNFSDLRWIRNCGDSRTQNVTFTATDDCGNFSTRVLTVATVDTTKPVFFNCPRPPIVVAAETFHCDAYVNFSPMAATDNCSNPIITQIDRTGLKSGDRFPVGTTMLVFEARDRCNNVDTCSLKIIVNDYWDVPSLTCPANITANATVDSCGVSVLTPSLRPSNISDNCPNTITTYQIKDSIGRVIKRGFTDATGSFFPVGRNTIDYCVYDQPLLLISEVTQMLGGAFSVGRSNPVPAFISANVAAGELIDGDYLEITNYGPSVLDLTCLSIEILEGLGTSCTYILPPKFPLAPSVFLAPGRVATFHVGSGTDSPANLFFNMNCSQAAVGTPRGYILRLNDRVIDVVATNGYNPVGRGAADPVVASDWRGALAPQNCRGSYYRINHVDLNQSTDWDLASSCTPATIGSLNKDHRFVPSNGDTVSLQSIPANVRCCSSTVTIIDATAPECARYDTLTFAGASNLNVPFNQGTCFRSIINVPQNCLVGDFRILDLTGNTSENLGDWKVTLVSPSGTRILIWDNICTASTSFNLNISELGNKGSANTNITSASCVPNFGNGGFFKAQELINSVYHERSNGAWTLEIEDNSCTGVNISNLLSNWRLQILCIASSTLRDTTITADFRQCRKKFLYFNPVFNDNCKNGRIDLSFTPVTTQTSCGTTITPSFVPSNKSNVQSGACDSVILAIGTTKFTYLLTDRAGNTSMCMYNVTVRDINAPVTFSNKDITLTAEDGTCEKIYYFTVDATDSCGVDSVWSNPPSGHRFPVGKNRVCVYSRDRSCNLDSACFTVTIDPFIPSSSQLACNDLITISLDATCRATLNADMILSGGNYYCYNDYIITVREENTNRPHGLIFTYDDVGKCFIATIRDPRSGNSCWGRVCIEDKQKPDIACPRDTVIHCLSSLDPNKVGRPTLLTCEQSYTWVYRDDFFEYDQCDTPYIAQINRYWIITDETGNADTCIQRIRIKRIDLSEIVFPRNYDKITPPHLECSDIRRNKDVSQHIIDFPYCVDGYLMDSAHWFATGGFLPSPQGDLAGERRPKALGWNYIDTGAYAGHPSPYPIYYEQHPQWPNNRFCWGPNQMVKWIGTGVPTIGGVDINEVGRCAIAINYTDKVYGICANGYEIFREWSIHNRCLPVIAGSNPLNYIQVIKVLDSKGPEFNYPDTLTLSTASQSCRATWVVDHPTFTDNCSDSVFITLRNWAGNAVNLPNGTWVVYNIPIGLHRMEIVAKDRCKNQTVKKMMLNVIDGTPPNVVCSRTTSVSITGNQSPGENYARVYANTLDEGSYDNCQNHVYFKVIRMAELLGTNNGSNANNLVACNGLNGDDNPVLAGNQVYFDDFTTFCCTDAGTKVMVVLRVFDVDPGTGPIAPARMTNANSPLRGRFSDCMVEVDVQNKTIPTIIPPPNIVVSCSFWFDIANISNPSDATFGRVVTDLSTRKKVVTQDIVCHKFCERNQRTQYPGFVQTNTVPKPAPNLACDYYNQFFDTAHWDRKYELVWGFDGYVLGGCTANPTITVNDLRECGQGQIQRVISAIGPNNLNVSAIQTIWVVDCDPFFVDDQTCNDPRFTDLLWPNGVCTQTPITVEGCGGDISPDNPQLGRPSIINNADDNCALISVEYRDEIFTIEPDACFKIIRTWIVIDWCQYDPFIDPNVGRWQATQVIKVRDKNKPVVTCEVGQCEPASINATTNSCYGHISLTSKATDNCSPEDWLLWEYKVDINNDGIGVHAGYDLRVGSLTKRSSARGDTVEYSHNPYADDRHNPFDASGTYPIGIHKICWFVEDGCANVGTCCTLFEIKDCKAPTPYCLTGVITVPMPATGCVDVWAKDLDRGSFDNCTNKDDLKFYFNGDPNKQSIKICCDDFVQAQVNDELRVEVEMWVEDQEGNKDYCKTVVIIQDNQDICPNSTVPKGTITGELKTIKNDESKPVQVSLYSEQILLSQKEGSPYRFGDLNLAKEYQINPERNDDHLNGVSTQDIVLLQKHILGKSIISSPYQLIAADVNNSGSITSADISEMRKLILGITTEFSKVKSWTFVPKNYEFLVPNEPFKAPRNSVIKFNQSTISEAIKSDFVAIKMGDISLDAVANGHATKTRTNSSLDLIVDENYHRAGDIVELNITSDNFVNIEGYQFTLKFDENLIQFEGFEKGILNVNDENFGKTQIANGILTTSWNSNKAESFKSGEVLMKLKFRCISSTQLSKAITINSDLTPALAFGPDQVWDVRLKLKNGNSYVEGEIFELYQNEPNPFIKSTVISYTLPESSPVTLSIYDQFGKVIRIYNLHGNKGMNQIKLNKEDLNGNSIFYYQLDAENNSATRKMILME